MKNFIENLNPNILLTEICNQTCDYCFAKNEMESAAKKDGFLKIEKQSFHFQDLQKHKRYWRENLYLNILLGEMAGECTDTHFGKVKREKLEKLTNKSFIMAMEKREKEILSKNLDLNSFV